MTIVAAALAAIAACSETPEAPDGDEGSTPSGQIGGKVTDTEGAPGAGLRLGIVSGTVPFPEITPFSSSDGSYLFSDIQPGTFKVAVYDDDGNVLRQHSVEVRNGETSTLDFSVDTVFTLSPLAAAVTEVPLSELFGVDLKTCNGFLDEPPSNMVLKTREFTEVAREDDPSIVSMCQASHETLDGSGGVLVTVISFDSEPSAKAHFENILSGFQGSEVTTGVLGTESFQAVVNKAGVGSFVVLWERIYTVQTHIAVSEDQELVREVGQLVDLTSRVKERLP